MPHYEPGVYQAEVLGQEFRPSTSKGTPGFHLKIRPEGGAYERELTFWITEKTAEYVARDLAKLGFRGSSFAELEPGTPNYHSFAGDTITVVCSHEKSNTDPNKVFERWQLPYEGGETGEPMASKDVRKLDALFGKHLKRAAKAAPAESKPITPEDAKAEADDSDVPF